MLSVITTLINDRKVSVFFNSDGRALGQYRNKILECTSSESL